MTAPLPAVTRERLRRFMRVMTVVAIVGAGFGTAYAFARADPGAGSLLRSLLVSIPISVIDALLTGAWVAGIEIFLLPRASMQWLDALPFAAVFILKTLVSAPATAASRSSNTWMTRSSSAGLRPTAC